MVEDRVAAELSSASESPAADSPVDDDAESIRKRDNAEVEKRLNALAFLPCVIVQGHTWSIAATTYNPGSKKTTLWSEYTFGDTKTQLGIWKVLAGLRWLVRWSEEEYWPWFTRYVCGLTP